jgi:hypothetical protein
MGAAESIAFEDVRARKPWHILRQQLHARFDQWLDTLEQQWHEPPSILMGVTASVWALRQQLTGVLPRRSWRMSTVVTTTVIRPLSEVPWGVEGPRTRLPYRRNHGGANTD